MEKKGKAIFSILMIVFCVIQIIILAANYAKSSSNIGTNPLIPQSLTLYIRNFTLLMGGGYLSIALINIFYLIKKRYFIPVCSISVAGIFLLRFYIVEIHEWFITN